MGDDAGDWDGAEGTRGTDRGRRKDRGEGLGFSLVDQSRRAFDGARSCWDWMWRGDGGRGRFLARSGSMGIFFVQVHKMGEIAKSILS